MSCRRIALSLRSTCNASLCRLSPEPRSADSETSEKAKAVGRWGDGAMRVIVGDAAISAADIARGVCMGTVVHPNSRAPMIAS